MVSREQKKVSPNGKKENSASSPAKGNVIARAVSFLKRKPKAQYIVKIPKGRPIGKVIYTVQSPLEPVTFNKKKEAVAFSKLLESSLAGHKSDIVRREITNDHYCVTY